MQNTLVLVVMKCDFLSNAVSVAPHHPRRAWSATMLRTLLENRSLCLVISGVALAYLALLTAGLVLYRCPLHSTTGLLCAGCGLSTAILSMLQGDFSQMWIQHPFAPYFAILGSMVIGSAVLPAPLRIKWNSFWIALENRSSVHGIVLIIFCVFGALRLLVQLRITS